MFCLTDLDFKIITTFFVVQLALVQNMKGKV